MGVTVPRDTPLDPAASLPRRLLLLSGAPADLHSWLAQALDGASKREVLWVGTHAIEGVAAVTPAQVVQRLGSESRLAVFDAHGGFDPDAFAAAVGTLRGGGDCVVLTPPLAQWPGYADPYHARIAPYPWRPEQLAPAFIERLVRTWGEDPRCVRLTPSSEPGLRFAPAPATGRLHLNADQQAMVEQVVRVAYGHARRPLVLSADRGRGKSTVLGFAAARLLRDGRMPRITVVAPHRRAVETLFRHARTQAGLAAAQVGDLALGNTTLRFRLPGDCLATTDDPGLLLVDEAAALSIGVLDRLLRRSNRLVFATTEQGYEGSGRGFRLRFEALLRHAMPQFRRARLETPVRWAPADPLEALVNEGLLLSTELPALAPGPDVVQAERLPARALRRDEGILRGVVGLLVGAHYQTRPSDLRRLLDDPGLSLWVARHGPDLCGVLLGAVEGGFDDAIADRILAGRRRPHGHLLAQSLAVHAGFDAALSQRTLRVVRIAVHPAQQRRGIGRRLLAAARAWAVSERLDGLGCAFGSETGLLAFWMAQGLRPVRLGLRIDPASAAHSLMMLDGLSPAGRSLATAAFARFQRDLPWSLGDVCSDLPPALAIALLRGRDCADLPLAAADLTALARIAAGARQPATATPVIRRWLVRAISDGAAGLEPLVARYLQHWPMRRVCETYVIAGGAALDRQLRERLADAENASRPSG